MRVTEEAVVEKKDREMEGKSKSEREKLIDKQKIQQTNRMKKQYRKRKIKRIKLNRKQKYKQKR